MHSGKRDLSEKSRAKILCKTIGIGKQEQEQTHFSPEWKWKLYEIMQGHSDVGQFHKGYLVI